MTGKRFARYLFTLVVMILFSAMIAPYARAQTAEVPTWMNRISLGGDLYFRFQQTNSNGAIDAVEALRTRIGLSAKLNDELTGNVRLATGLGSGTNANLVSTSLQNEGDGWAKKGFWLDIASLDYRPLSGVVFTVGKAISPLYSGGKNEMILNANVIPEGLSIKYAGDFGAFKPFLTASHLMIVDNGADKADTTLAAAQIGVSMKVEPVAATLSVASYNFNDMKDHAPIYFATGKGNSLTGGNYAYEYHLTDLEGELTMTVFGLPFTAYGGHVQNSDPSERNKGTIGGLRVGNIAEPSSWSVNYNYRDVQADATVGAFVESDQAGVTDVRGNRLSISYTLSKGVVTSLTGAWMRTNASTTNTPWERYYLDVLATF